MTQANNYLQVCTCADEDNKPCPIHDKPVKGVLTTTIPSPAGSWNLPACEKINNNTERNEVKMTNSEPFGNPERLDDERVREVLERIDRYWVGMFQHSELRDEDMDDVLRLLAETTVKLEGVTKDRDSLEGLVHVNERLNQQIIGLKELLRECEVLMNGLMRDDYLRVGEIKLFDKITKKLEEK